MELQAALVVQSSRTPSQRFGEAADEVRFDISGLQSYDQRSMFVVSMWNACKPRKFIGLGMDVNVASSACDDM